MLSCCVVGRRVMQCAVVFCGMLHDCVMLRPCCVIYLGCCCVVCDVLCVMYMLCYAVSVVSCCAMYVVSCCGMLKIRHKMATYVHN